jgi:hypothetical protein
MSCPGIQEKYGEGNPAILEIHIVGINSMSWLPSLLIIWGLIPIDHAEFERYDLYLLNRFKVRSFKTMVLTTKSFIRDLYLPRHEKDSLLSVM